MNPSTRFLRALAAILLARLAIVLAETIDMPDDVAATTTSRVNLEDRIEFQCKDGQTSATSAWLYDDGSGSAPLDVGSSDLYQTSTSAIGSVLVIKAITSDMNSTRYRCKSAGGWAKLVVNRQKPSIRGVPSSVSIAMGTTLVLKYRVIAMPKPTSYEWIRDGDTIDGGRTTFNETTLSNPIGVTTQFNGSVYSFTVKNAAGEDKKSFVLDLYYLHLLFNTPLTRKNGTTIECTVETFPELTSVFVQRPDGIRQPASAVRKVEPERSERHAVYRHIVRFFVSEANFYGGHYTVKARNVKTSDTVVQFIDGPKLPTTEPTSAPTTVLPGRKSTSPPTRRVGGNQDKGKGGGLGWYVYFIVAVVVLVVAGFGIGIAVYYRGKKRNSDGTRPIVPAMEKSATGYPVSETTSENPTYKKNIVPSAKDNGVSSAKDSGTLHYAELEFPQSNSTFGVPRANGDSHYGEIQS